VTDSAGFRRVYALRAAIPVLFAILGALYSVVTPLWEAPDEVGHWAYIDTLLRRGRLPILQPDVQDEAHQPPLYYALAAIPASFADLGDRTGAFRVNPDFVWAGQGGDAANIAQHGTAETFPYRGVALGVHLARLVSVLCGAVTVGLAGRLARTVFPLRPGLALLVPLAIALNPMFVYLHGSVNNDALLITLSTVCLHWLVRILEEPERVRWWTQVGVILALGLLTKLSIAVTGALAVAVLVASAVRSRSVAVFIIGAWRMAVPIALLSGWWFIRNAYEYGDALAWGAFRETFASVLRSQPLTWRDVVSFFSVQWRSFWGVFGWMTVVPPAAYHALYSLVSLLGLGGCGIIVARRTYRLWPERAKRGTVVLLGVLLLQEAYLLAAIFRFDASWYQGRYLFPIIAALAFALSLGLVAMAETLRIERHLLWAGLVPVALAVAVPFAVIRPAYEIVPVSKVAARLVPNRHNVAFGNGLRLVGHRVSVNSRTGLLSLTLYWKADTLQTKTYSVFAHAVDGDQQLIAQHDLVPGADRGYPPQVWWVGDVVAARHEMRLDPDTARDVAEIRVGLYDPVAGDRAPIVSGGPDHGTYVTLLLD